MAEEKAHTSKEASSHHHESHFALIAIVAIVAIVGLVVLFEGKSFVGEAKAGEVVDKLVCTDSDGGKNYYVKGTATNSKGDSGTDYCANDYPSWNMIEFYCDGKGVVANWGYLCPAGCKDGACIK